MSRDTALVSADWAEKNLETPGIVFVEVDEDTTAYDGGHIPGAVTIDWKKDLQEEQSQPAGHTPTAINVPSSKAANEHGTFKSDDELSKIYGEAGLDGSKDTIAYCRIGERSSHTWFVLKELLGQQNVKNYDGSWTEWGSLVGVPVALGDDPGSADA